MAFLTETPSEGALELLIRLAMFYPAPEPDIAYSIGEAALTQARSATGDLRERYHDILMQLAQHWGTPSVAEALSDLLPFDDLGGAALVSQALSISASYRDELAQRETLAKHLFQAGQRATPGPQAQQLVRAIQALINVDPALASLLQPALRSAVLAG
jgi:hypothetical protein